MPGPLWLSDYEPQESSCPFSQKICLECEFAERLALTGVPLDCKRGHIEKVKSLWYYMFKGYNDRSRETGSAVFGTGPF